MFLSRVRAFGIGQCLVSLSQELLLGALFLLLLTNLGEQARIVTIQLCQFVLLDHQGLLQLPQLHLQLLYLGLMPTLLLLTLLLASHAIMFKGIAGVLMLLFK